MQTRNSISKNVWSFLCNVKKFVLLTLFGWFQKIFWFHGLNFCSTRETCLIEWTKVFGWTVLLTLQNSVATTNYFQIRNCVDSIKYFFECIKFNINRYLYNFLILNIEKGDTRWKWIITVVKQLLEYLGQVVYMRVFGITKNVECTIGGIGIPRSYLAVVFAYVHDQQFRAGSVAFTSALHSHRLDTSQVPIWSSGSRQWPCVPFILSLSPQPPWTRGAIYSQIRSF